MKTFILTSARMQGEIEFRFDDAGYLHGYENRAVLTPDQQEWLLARLPKTLDGLKAVLTQSKGARLTEVSQEVTFEMFWDRYNEKTLSSKKKSMQRWDKMSQRSRQAAYSFIFNYLASLPQGVRKKYAETYLSSEIWDN